MKMINLKLGIMRYLGIICLPMIIVACDSSDSVTPPTSTPPATSLYHVEIRNLTLSQPLSPPAVILHNAGYNAWIDGDVASVALEMLAEGGDNTALLAEAAAATQHLASMSGTGPVGGGAMAGFDIEIQPGAQPYLTILTMLVNTNDAFTGINAIDISGLAAGESRSYSQPVWDSGTEENTESAATIPGPAAGGEGFNSSRANDVDFIGFHGGVITQDDGLASSVLTESHRFEQPVAQIRVNRIR